MTPQLDEKDFIHEEYPKNRRPFLGWLATVIFFSLLLSGASMLYFATLEKQYDDNPFLQVTNRAMSLFLWQNPQHMRIHAKNKSYYLPAFQYAEKIGLNPIYADDYVIAPPELLFLYHTWKRLLGEIYIPREISAKQFLLFLVAAPEWEPRYWKEAPLEYVDLINTLKDTPSAQLALQNIPNLPLEVRQAFLGWKNYFFEGNAINSVEPTYGELAKFLAIYPAYNRNFWCNIEGTSYLKSLEFANHNEETAIPSGELSPLLRAAYFNWTFTNSGMVQAGRYLFR